MKLSFYFLAFAFVFFHHTLAAQTDTVYIIPTQTIVGDQVRVDFPVQQFEGIACLQYTMNYDADILQFENVGNINLPGLDENSFAAPESGKITFSWLDMTLQGLTLADGESIYSVFFSMAGSAGASDLFIDGSLTQVEACISTEEITLIFNNISIASLIASSNENLEARVGVNVFPNPSTDQVTFDISNLDGAVEIEVYNNVGQLMETYKTEDQILTISKTHKMTVGTYHYRISADGAFISSGKFTLN